MGIWVAVADVLYWSRSWTTVMCYASMLSGLLAGVRKSKLSSSLLSDERQTHAHTVHRDATKVDVRIHKTSLALDVDHAIHNNHMNDFLTVFCVGRFSTFARSLQPSWSLPFVLSITFVLSLVQIRDDERRGPPADLGPAGKIWSLLSLYSNSSSFVCRFGAAMIHRNDDQGRPADLQ